MPNKTVIVADDLADRTTKGRLRSKVLRDMAAEIAAKGSLDATVLYIKDLSAGLFKKKQFQSFIENFENIASSIEDGFRKKGVKGAVAIRSGSPAEEILNFVETSTNAEYLILATQSKKGLTKMLLGSVAEEVLRRTTLPTFVMGPAAQENRNSFLIRPQMRLLVLSDFSKCGEAAEKVAIEFCKKHGAKIVLAHSVGEQILHLRQNLYGSGYIPFDMDKMFTEMTQDAQRTLQRKSRRWQREGVEAEPLLIQDEESMDRTLKKILRLKFDLVVMGTHGRNKLMTAFLGSTARKVISLSPLPVLVAHSK